MPGRAWLGSTKRDCYVSQMISLECRYEQALVLDPGYRGASENIAAAHRTLQNYEKLVLPAPALFGGISLEGRLFEEIGPVQPKVRPGVNSDADFTQC